MAAAALWVDKYRPNTLNKLTFHHEMTSRLEALAQCEEIPHLLVYGPPGAGKKTRVLAFLREVYGPGVERVKLEHKSFKTASGKAVEISLVASNYHLECNPSEVGNNDRLVIQEVIKEIASHGNLQSSVGAPGSRPFKILLLTEVDRLSKQAQAGLRRTMEKYSAQCRIILLCNSPSKVIEPVRSRCLGFRIPAPAVDEIASLLTTVARKEGLSVAPDTALRLAVESGRNLRRSLLMLEALRMQQSPSTSLLLTSGQPTPLPDWQVYINKLAREILAEQTPSKLLQAREMLYALLTNCIPADIILATLTNDLLQSLDDSVKHEVVHWAAYYAERLASGSKEIFHLEAFVAKVMALYKRWIISVFG
eukprot:gene4280-4699_t